jgi:hypothetical protein
MNINDFNSKVNLPRVISKLGADVKEFEFIRMPVFGWYAKSKSGNFIGNIFDFFQHNEWAGLYSNILENFEDCLDFKLPRSQVAGKRLFENYVRHMEYHAAWLMSKEELQKHKARYGSKVMYFRDILVDAGMPAFELNEAGYLTENVVNNFKRLDLDAKRKYKKVLIIPSFNTPKHICSFELAKYDQPQHREKMYVNAEVGWYGRMGKNILANFNELKVHQGFLWNYKADYWTPEDVKLSSLIATPQLIQIWSDSKKTTFQESPIEVIAKKEGMDEVHNHIASLSYPQVEELQKKLGLDLMPAWVASKENQFVVLNKTFIRRGNAYYVQAKDHEELISNFAIEMTEIKKRELAGEEEFWWCGFLLHGNSVVPFEMNDKYFASCYLFAKGIRKQFFSLGLGLPFINERYLRQLLSLVQLSAHGVTINADVEA